MEFEWDKSKPGANLNKHGVSFEEGTVGLRNSGSGAIAISWVQLALRDRSTQIYW